MNVNRVNFDDNKELYFINFEGKKVFFDGDFKTEKSLNEIAIWLESNITSIKDFGAEWLLDLKNDDLYEQNKDEITKREFIENLNLLDIIIHPENNLDLIFSANNMFYGDGITIFTDKNLTLTKAIKGYI